MTGPRFLRVFFFQVTGSPGVRFRKYDKPTEASFRQLFDSVGFLKEKDDTSTTTTQGFTKICQDAAADSRNSTPDLDGFTKGIIPHQLPNVYKNPNYPLTGISVSNLSTANGRIGGVGRDFLIRNTMEVAPAATPGNPIIVLQGQPGEDVTIDLNMSLLPLGLVKVNVLDPTASYLDQAIASDNTCRLNVAADPTNEQLVFKYRDKKSEMTMYSNTNVQFAIDFPGNVGTGCWLGWVLADGGTYLDSNATPVTVQDMRGVFPVGFFPAGLYPTLQSNVDSGALSGENAHALTTNELAVHNHAAGTLVTNSTGAHTHSIDIAFNIIQDGAAGTPRNALDTAQPGAATIVTDSAGTHSHSISGNTANAGAGTAHENRPPFGVVAFVVYIG